MAGSVKEGRVGVNVYIYGDRADPLTEAERAVAEDVERRFGLDVLAERLGCTEDELGAEPLALEFGASYGSGPIAVCAGPKLPGASLTASGRRRVSRAFRRNPALNFEKCDAVLYWWFAAATELRLLLPTLTWTVNIDDCAVPWDELTNAYPDASENDQNGDLDRKPSVWRRGLDRASAYLRRNGK